jgi:hypothetical protein
MNSETGKQILYALVGNNASDGARLMLEKFIKGHPEIEVIIVSPEDLKNFSPAKTELVKLDTQMIIKSFKEYEPKDFPVDQEEIRFNKEQNKLRQRRHDFNNHKYKIR